MNQPLNTPPGFFRFREFSPDRFLLTNDTGAHLFVDRAGFESLRNGKLGETLQEDLRREGFFLDDADQEESIAAFRNKYAYLQGGPSLHIVVTTLRCDHKCVYCHASRESMDAPQFDMDLETAEKTVDFILQSNAHDMCIEFQGGEPLANFPVVKHIIEYTRSKNPPKDIIFSIVTNLSLMDEDKLRFLSDNQVAVCTSLDGPESVHNRHRVFPGGNSFDNTVRWIRRIAEDHREKMRENEKFSRVNALLTVSRDLFGAYRETVDLYRDLGLASIHLRPLNPFGLGKRLSQKQPYTAEEFVDFYRNTLDYILELNRSGHLFFEKTAQILLKKILLKIDPGFMDLRSPCGAGIGQLAYHFDGGIFTCDEGRMLHATGDDSFRLGNVKSDSFQEVIRSETVRNMCIASCLEGLPGCSDCAYNPYCGVCPVYNHVEQGSIFGQMPSNQRCRILLGIQDYLFQRLEDNRDIFETWINDQADGVGHDPLNP